MPPKKDPPIDPETGGVADGEYGPPTGAPGPTTPPELDLTGVVIPGITGPGGGGGGSSGGGGAPADPTIAEAEGFYYQLWGRRAPAGYVANFLDGSTDLFDFMRFQLSRPGARKTRFYANAFANYAAQAAQIMGRR